MKTQLKQVFFLAIFWFLSTLFVFFVPRWSSSETTENDILNKEVIEQIDSSWDIQNAILTWEFLFTLDPVFLTWNFLQFIDDFSQKRWIQITINELSQPFSDSLFSGDLVLVPYDYLTWWASFQPIGFQEDIRSLFIPQIQNFIEGYSGFLPFALDPAVMYGLPMLEAGLDGVYSAFSAWKPRTALSSFSFWLFDSSSLYDQNLLFSQQLEDFITFNDVGSFQQWLEMNHLLPEQKERFYDFVFVSDQSYTPIIKGVVELAFGFFSHFWSLSSDWESTVWVQWYPYQYVGLPSRLYGFVIPTSGEYRELVNQFLLDYMDFAFSSWEYSFASSANMIPVFQNEFAYICKDSLCNLSEELVIIKNGPAKIQRFLKDKLLWKVIEKKIKPDLYLREASL